MDTSRGDTVAIVLAGGAGRRLGVRAPGGKAALELAGRSMLEHVVTAAAPHVRRVIVVVAPGQSPTVRNHPIDVVSDSSPAAGPLAALADGLRHALTHEPRARFAIVLSCDVPLVRTAVVGRLLDELARSGCRWVVPNIGGHRQPLVSALAIDCRTDVERRLAAGGRDLLGLLEDLEAATPGAVVELSEHRLADCDPRLDSFRDVDTPADLLAVRARRDSTSPG